MTQYTLLTTIVPAEAVQTYRDLAAEIHPAGADMFLTPLYTGEELTHYISTGLIDVAFADIVSSPEAFSNATGFTLAEAEELRDGMAYQAVGLEGDPEPLHNREAIASLGLSLEPMGAVE